MTNHPSLADIVSFFKSFADKKNPFNDEGIVMGHPAKRKAAFQDWMTSKECFKYLTGHSKFTTACLDSWTRKHADRLVEELTPVEYTDLATWAAGYYQNALLMAMIERMPDVLKERDSGGHTVLHTAAWARNEPALRKLIPLWGGHHQPFDDEGRLPLECLILHRGNGSGMPWKTRNWLGTARECLRTAYELAPHWIEERLEGSNTLLHIAAGSRHPRTLCNDLVGYGLAWNDPNIAGFTPADILENSQYFKPTQERKSDPRDVRFYNESLEAGRVPRKSPGLLGRALARLHR